MLTFRFTGADGEMIQEEMLAAGMIGKQVRFEFSSDWDGLRKVAVYKAGTACCTSVDVGEVDTIPAEVLTQSLHRLFVGVYGISEDGSVVTPAVFAPGPFIHISAVMGDDPCFDPKNTFWIKLEQAIEETVRFTPQILTAAQQLQARENIGAVGKDEVGSGGISANAANLLMTILGQAVYSSDQSENLLALETALRTAGEEEAVYYAAVCVLEHVTATPESAAVAEGESFTAQLTAEDGYVLDAVTVTMDGVDITAQAYANGTVSISAVTGNVVIRASAVAESTGDSGEEPVVSYGITFALTNVTADNAQTAVEEGKSYSASLSAADGYVLDAVSVTMGGADVTASVYSGGIISIPAVTGNVVITASAVAEAVETAEYHFVAASASASTLDAKDPPIRMCAVKLSGVTPFPQYGAVYDGDVYPIPIPEGATVLNVVSPGLIGGIQFYTLSGGAYTNTLDSGWQTEGGFTYTFEADTHDYLFVNFKNSANSAFFTEDYDTSGISISFE